MTICNLNIYISFYNIEPGINSKISGVVWQVAPDSKIWLVSCELSPKYLIGISTLEYICAIDMNIHYHKFLYTYLRCFIYFRQSLCTIFRIFHVPMNFLFHFSGFRLFAIQWSSDPHLKHIFGFRPLRSARLF